MPILENDLRTALASVRDPHTGQDFVTSQALTNLTIEGGDVAFDVVLSYPAQSLLTPLRQQLIAAARTVAPCSTMYSPSSSARCSGSPFMTAPSRQSVLVPEYVTRRADIPPGA